MNPPESETSLEARLSALEALLKRPNVPDGNLYPQITALAASLDAQPPPIKTALFPALVRVLHKFLTRAKPSEALFGVLITALTSCPPQTALLAAKVLFMHSCKGGFPERQSEVLLNGVIQLLDTLPNNVFDPEFVILLQEVISYIPQFIKVNRFSNRIEPFKCKIFNLLKELLQAKCLFKNDSLAIEYVSLILRCVKFIGEFGSFEMKRQLPDFCLFVMNFCPNNYLLVRKEVLQVVSFLCISYKEIFTNFVSIILSPEMFFECEKLNIVCIQLSTDIIIAHSQSVTHEICVNMMNNIQNVLKSLMSRDLALAQTLEGYKVILLNMMKVFDHLYSFNISVEQKNSFLSASLSIIHRVIEVFVENIEVEYKTVLSLFCCFCYSMKNLNKKTTDVSADTSESISCLEGVSRNAKNLDSQIEGIKNHMRNSYFQNVPFPLDDQNFHKITKRVFEYDKSAWVNRHERIHNALKSIKNTKNLTILLFNAIKSLLISKNALNLNVSIEDIQTLELIYQKSVDVASFEIFSEDEGIKFCESFFSAFLSLKFDGFEFLVKSNLNKLFYNIQRPILSKTCIDELFCTNFEKMKSFQKFRMWENQIQEKTSKNEIEKRTFKLQKDSIAAVPENSNQDCSTQPSTTETDNRQGVRPQSTTQQPKIKNTQTDNEDILREDTHNNFTKANKNTHTDNHNSFNLNDQVDNLNPLNENTETASHNFPNPKTSKNLCSTQEDFYDLQAFENVLNNSLESHFEDLTTEIMLHDKKNMFTQDENVSCSHKEFCCCEHQFFWATAYKDSFDFGISRDFITNNLPSGSLSRKKTNMLPDFSVHKGSILTGDYIDLSIPESDLFPKVESRCDMHHLLNAHPRMPDCVCSRCLCRIFLKSSIKIIDHVFLTLVNLDSVSDTVIVQYLQYMLNVHIKKLRVKIPPARYIHTNNTSHQGFVIKDNTSSNEGIKDIFIDKDKGEAFSSLNITQDTVAHNFNQNADSLFIPNIETNHYFFVVSKPLLLFQKNMTLIMNRLSTFHHSIDLQLSHFLKDLIHYFLNNSLCEPIDYFLLSLLKSIDNRFSRSFEVISSFAVQITNLCLKRYYNQRSFVCCEIIFLATKFSFKVFENAVSQVEMILDVLDSSLTSHCLLFISDMFTYFGKSRFLEIFHNNVPTLQSKLLMIIKKNNDMGSLNKDGSENEQNVFSKDLLSIVQKANSRFECESVTNSAPFKNEVNNIQSNDQFNSVQSNNQVNNVNTMSNQFNSIHSNNQVNNVNTMSNQFNSIHSNNQMNSVHSNNQMNDVNAPFNQSNISNPLNRVNSIQSNIQANGMNPSKVGCSPTDFVPSNFADPLHASPCTNIFDINSDDQNLPLRNSALVQNTSPADLALTLLYNLGVHPKMGCIYPQDVTTQSIVLFNDSVSLIGDHLVLFCMRVLCGNDVSNQLFSQFGIRYRKFVSEGCLPLKVGMFYSHKFYCRHFSSTKESECDYDTKCFSDHGGTSDLQSKCQVNDYSNNLDSFRHQSEFRENESKFNDNFLSDSQSTLSRPHTFQNLENLDNSAKPQRDSSFNIPSCKKDNRLNDMLSNKQHFHYCPCLVEEMHYHAFCFLVQFIFHTQGWNEHELRGIIHNTSVHIKHMLQFGAHVVNFRDMFHANRRKFSHFMRIRNLNIFETVKNRQLIHDGLVAILCCLKRSFNFLVIEFLKLMVLEIATYRLLSSFLLHKKRCRVHFDYSVFVLPLLFYIHNCWEVFDFAYDFLMDICNDLEVLDECNFFVDIFNEFVGFLYYKDFHKRKAGIDGVLYVLRTCKVSKKVVVKYGPPLIEALKVYLRNGATDSFLLGQKSYFGVKTPSRDSAGKISRNDNLRTAFDGTTPLGQNNLKTHFDGTTPPGQNSNNYCESTIGQNPGYFQGTPLGQNSYSKSILGQNSYSKSILGQNSYSKSTLGQNSYSKSTLGQNSYSKSTLGQNSYSKSILGQNPGNGPRELHPEHSHTHSTEYIDYTPPFISQKDAIDFPESVKIILTILMECLKKTTNSKENQTVCQKNTKRETNDSFTNVQRDTNSPNTNEERDTNLPNTNVQRDTNLLDTKAQMNNNLLNTNSIINSQMNSVDTNSDIDSKMNLLDTNSDVNPKMSVSNEAHGMAQQRNPSLVCPCLQNQRDVILQCLLSGILTTCYKTYAMCVYGIKCYATTFNKDIGYVLQQQRAYLHECIDQQLVSQTSIRPMQLLGLLYLMENGIITFKRKNQKYHGITRQSEDKNPGLFEGTHHSSESFENLRQPKGHESEGICHTSESVDQNNENENHKSEGIESGKSENHKSVHANELECENAKPKAGNKNHQYSSEYPSSEHPSNRKLQNKNHKTTADLGSDEVLDRIVHNLPSTHLSHREILTTCMFYNKVWKVATHKGLEVIVKTLCKFAIENLSKESADLLSIVMTENNNLEQFLNDQKNENFSAKEPNVCQDSTHERTSHLNITYKMNTASNSDPSHSEYKTNTALDSDNTEFHSGYSGYTMDAPLNSKNSDLAHSGHTMKAALNSNDTDLSNTRFKMDTPLHSDNTDLAHSGHTMKAALDSNNTDLSNTRFKMDTPLSSKNSDLAHSGHTMDSPLNSKNTYPIDKKECRGCTYIETPFRSSEGLSCEQTILISFKNTIKSFLENTPSTENLKRLQMFCRIFKKTNHIIYDKLTTALSKDTIKDIIHILKSLHNVPERLFMEIIKNRNFTKNHFSEIRKIIQNNNQLIIPLINEIQTNSDMELMEYLTIDNGFRYVLKYLLNDDRDIKSFLKQIIEENKGSTEDKGSEERILIQTVNPILKKIIEDKEGTTEDIPTQNPIFKQIIEETQLTNERVSTEGIPTQNPIFKQIIEETQLTNERVSTEDILNKMVDLICENKTDYEKTLRIVFGNFQISEISKALQANTLEIKNKIKLLILTKTKLTKNHLANTEIANHSKKLYEQILNNLEMSTNTINTFYQLQLPYRTKNIEILKKQLKLNNLTNQAMESILQDLTILLKIKYKKNNHYEQCTQSYKTQYTPNRDNIILESYKQHIYKDTNYNALEDSILRKTIRNPNNVDISKDTIRNPEEVNILKHTIRNTNEANILKDTIRNSNKVDILKKTIPNTNEGNILGGLMKEIDIPGCGRMNYAGDIAYPQYISDNSETLAISHKTNKENSISQLQNNTNPENFWNKEFTGSKNDHLTLRDRQNTKLMHICPIRCLKQILKKSKPRKIHEHEEKNLLKRLEHLIENKNNRIKSLIIGIFTLLKIESRKILEEANKLVTTDSTYVQKNMQYLCMCEPDDTYFQPLLFSHYDFQKYTIQSIDFLLKNKYNQVVEQTILKNESICKICQTTNQESRNDNLSLDQGNYKNISFEQVTYNDKISLDQGNYANISLDRETHNDNISFNKETHDDNISFKQETHNDNISFNRGTHNDNLRCLDNEDIQNIKENLSKNTTLKIQEILGYHKKSKDDLFIHLMSKLLKNNMITQTKRTKHSDILEYKKKNQLYNQYVRIRANLSQCFKTTANILQNTDNTKEISRLFQNFLQNQIFFKSHINAIFPVLIKNPVLLTKDMVYDIYETVIKMIHPMRPMYLKMGFQLLSIISDKYFSKNTSFDIESTHEQSVGMISHLLDELFGNKKNYTPFDKDSKERSIICNTLDKLSENKKNHPSLNGNSEELSKIISQHKDTIIDETFKESMRKGLSKVISEQKDTIIDETFKNDLHIILKNGFSALITAQLHSKEFHININTKYLPTFNRYNVLLRENNMQSTQIMDVFLNQAQGVFADTLFEEYLEDFTKLFLEFTRKSLISAMDFNDSTKLESNIHNMETLDHENTLGQKTNTHENDDSTKLESDLPNGEIWNHGNTLGQKTNTHENDDSTKLESDLHNNETLDHENTLGQKTNTHENDDSTKLESDLHNMETLDHENTLGQNKNIFENDQHILIKIVNENLSIRNLISNFDHYPYLAKYSKFHSEHIIYENNGITLESPIQKRLSNLLLNTLSGVLIQSLSDTNINTFVLKFIPINSLVQLAQFNISKKTNPILVFVIVDYLLRLRKSVFEAQSAQKETENVQSKTNRNSLNSIKNYDEQQKSPIKGSNRTTLRSQTNDHNKLSPILESTTIHKNSESLFQNTCAHSNNEEFNYSPSKNSLKSISNYNKNSGLMDSKLPCQDLLKTHAKLDTHKSLSPQKDSKHKDNMIVNSVHSNHKPETQHQNLSYTQKTFESSCEEIRDIITMDMDDFSDQKEKNNVSEKIKERSKTAQMKNFIRNIEKASSMSKFEDFFETRVSEKKPVVNISNTTIYILTDSYIANLVSSACSFLLEICPILCSNLLDSFLHFNFDMEVLRILDSLISRDLGFDFEKYVHVILQSKVIQVHEKVSFLNKCGNTKKPVAICCEKYHLSICAKLRETLNLDLKIQKNIYSQMVLRLDHLLNFYDKNYKPQRTILLEQFFIPEIALLRNKDFRNSKEPSYLQKELNANLLRYEQKARIHNRQNTFSKRIDNLSSFCKSLKCKYQFYMETLLKMHFNYPRLCIFDKISEKLLDKKRNIEVFRTLKNGRTKVVSQDADKNRSKEIQHNSLNDFKSNNNEAIEFSEDNPYTSVHSGKSVEETQSSKDNRLLSNHYFKENSKETEISDKNRLLLKDSLKENTKETNFVSENAPLTIKETDANLTIFYLELFKFFRKHPETRVLLQKTYLKGMKNHNTVVRNMYVNFFGDAISQEPFSRMRYLLSYDWSLFDENFLHIVLILMLNTPLKLDAFRIYIFGDDSYYDSMFNSNPEYKQLNLNSNSQSSIKSILEFPEKVKAYEVKFINDIVKNLIFYEAQLSLNENSQNDLQSNLLQLAFQFSDTTVIGINELLPAHTKKYHHDYCNDAIIEQNTGALYSSSRSDTQSFSETTFLGCNCKSDSLRRLFNDVKHLRSTNFPNCLRNHELSKDASKYVAEKLFNSLFSCLVSQFSISEISIILKDTFKCIQNNKNTDFLVKSWEKLLKTCRSILNSKKPNINLSYDLRALVNQNKYIEYYGQRSKVHLEKFQTAYSKNHDKNLTSDIHSINNQEKGFLCDFENERSKTRDTSKLADDKMSLLNHNPEHNEPGASGALENKNIISQNSNHPDACIDNLVLNSNRLTEYTMFGEKITNLLEQNHLVHNLTDVYINNGNFVQYEKMEGVNIPLLRKKVTSRKSKFRMFRELENDEDQYVYHTYQSNLGKTAYKHDFMTKAKKQNLKDIIKNVMTAFSSANFLSIARKTNTYANILNLVYQKETVLKEMGEKDLYYGRIKSILPRNLINRIFKKKYKKAQKMIEKFQLTENNESSDEIKKILQIMENEWVECAKKLQQWDILLELSNILGDMQLNTEVAYNTICDRDVNSVKNLLKIRKDTLDKQFMELFIQKIEIRKEDQRILGEFFLQNHKKQLTSNSTRKHPLENSNVLEKPSPWRTIKQSQQNIERQSGICSKKDQPSFVNNQLHSKQNNVIHNDSNKQNSSNTSENIQIGNVQRYDSKGLSVFQKTDQKINQSLLAANQRVQEKNEDLDSKKHAFNSQKVQNIHSPTINIPNLNMSPNFITASRQFLHQPVGSSSMQSNRQKIERMGIQANDLISMQNMQQIDQNNMRNNYQQMNRMGIRPNDSISMQNKQIDHNNMQSNLQSYKSNYMNQQQTDRLGIQANDLISMQNKQQIDRINMQNNVVSMRNLQKQFQGNNFVKPQNFDNIKGNRIVHVNPSHVSAVNPRLQQERVTGQNAQITGSIQKNVVSQNLQQKDRNFANSNAISPHNNYSSFNSSTQYLNQNLRIPNTNTLPTTLQKQNDHDQQDNKAQNLNMYNQAQRNTPQFINLQETRKNDLKHYQTYGNHTAEYDPSRLRTRNFDNFNDQSNLSNAGRNDISQLRHPNSSDQQSGFNNIQQAKFGFQQAIQNQNNIQSQNSINKLPRNEGDFSSQANASQNNSFNMQNMVIPRANVSLASTQMFPGQTQIQKSTEVVNNGPTERKNNPTRGFQKSPYFNTNLPQNNVHSSKHHYFHEKNSSNEISQIPDTENSTHSQTVDRTSQRNSQTDSQPQSQSLSNDSSLVKNHQHFPTTLNQNTSTVPGPRRTLTMNESQNLLRTSQQPKSCNTILSSNKSNLLNVHRIDPSGQQAISPMSFENTISRQNDFCSDLRNMNALKNLQKLSPHPSVTKGGGLHKKVRNKMTVDSHKGVLIALLSKNPFRANFVQRVQLLKNRYIEELNYSEESTPHFLNRLQVLDHMIYDEYSLFFSKLDELDDFGIERNNLDNFFQTHTQPKSFSEAFSKSIIQRNSANLLPREIIDCFFSSDRTLSLGQNENFLSFANEALDPKQSLFEKEMSNAEITKILRISDKRLRFEDSSLENNDRTLQVLKSNDRSVLSGIYTKPANEKLGSLFLKSTSFLFTNLQISEKEDLACTELKLNYLLEFTPNQQKPAIYNSFTKKLMQNNLNEQALFYLQKIFILGNIEMADAFEKIVAEIQALKNLKLYQNALDTANGVNVSFFNDKQKAQFLKIKAELLIKLRSSKKNKGSENLEELGENTLPPKHTNIDFLFYSATQLCDSDDIWYSWGVYLDNQYQKAFRSKNSKIHKDQKTKGEKITDDANKKEPIDQNNFLSSDQKYAINEINSQDINYNSETNGPFENSIEKTFNPQKCSNTSKNTVCSKNEDDFTQEKLISDENEHPHAISKPDENTTNLSAVNLDHRENSQEPLSSLPNLCERAFSALLRASLSKDSKKARKALLRIIKYLKKCDFFICDQLSQYLPQIETSRLIFFIPQYIELLSSSKSECVTLILATIIQKYPQAIFLDLKTELDRKKQIIDIVSRSDSCRKQTNISHSRKSQTKNLSKSKSFDLVENHKTDIHKNRSFSGESNSLHNSSFENKETAQHMKYGEFVKALTSNTIENGLCNEKLQQRDKHPKDDESFGDSNIEGIQYGFFNKKSQQREVNSEEVNYIHPSVKLQQIASDNIVKKKPGFDNENHVQKESRFGTYHEKLYSSSLENSVPPKLAHLIGNFNLHDLFTIYKLTKISDLLVNTLENSAEENCYRVSNAMFIQATTAIFEKDTSRTLELSQTVRRFLNSLVSSKINKKYIEEFYFDFFVHRKEYKEPCAISTGSHLKKKTRYENKQFSHLNSIHEKLIVESPRLHGKTRYENESSFHSKQNDPIKSSESHHSLNDSDTSIHTAQNCNLNENSEEQSRLSENNNSNSFIENDKVKVRNSESAQIRKLSLLEFTYLAKKWALICENILRSINYTVDLSSLQVVNDYGAFNESKIEMFGQYKEIQEFYLSKVYIESFDPAVLYSWRNDNLIKRIESRGTDGRIYCYAFQNLISEVYQREDRIIQISQFIENQSEVPLKFTPYINIAHNARLIKTEENITFFDDILDTLKFRNSCADTELVFKYLKSLNLHKIDKSYFLSKLKSHTRENSPSTQSSSSSRSVSRISPQSPNSVHINFSEKFDSQPKTTASDSRCPSVTNTHKMDQIYSNQSRVSKSDNSCSEKISLRKRISSETTGVSSKNNNEISIKDNQIFPAASGLKSSKHNRQTIDSSKTTNHSRNSRDSNLEDAITSIQNQEPLIEEFIYSIPKKMQLQAYLDVLKIINPDLLLTYIEEVYDTPFYFIKEFCKSFCYRSLFMSLMCIEKRTPTRIAFGRSTAKFYNHDLFPGLINGVIQTGEKCPMRLTQNIVNLFGSDHLCGTFYKITHEFSSILKKSDYFKEIVTVCITPFTDEPHVSFTSIKSRLKKISKNPDQYISKSMSPRNLSRMNPIWHPWF